MSGDDSIVFIVDDDPSMCEALTRLLGTVGLRAQAPPDPRPIASFPARRRFRLLAHPEGRALASSVEPPLLLPDPMA